jgi:2-polyprenyl-6-methoxyphenol hydroxylase-like FAD-dependent oxidoreductase
MPVMPEKYDVIICGAGPVGLFLGCMLAGTGISFIILETRRAPSLHSRSIGIHPPSIRLFDDIGLGEKLIERGVRIKRGIAYHDHGRLGLLDFSILPPPHRYVLTVPQFLTENLLEEHLVQVRKGSIMRGMNLTESVAGGNTVYIKAADANGGQHSMEAKYLIGCDGKNSTVRKNAGIEFRGKSYPDTYVMGDFPDHTGSSETAEIYLHSGGLVETFPLPGGFMRWVVKTGEISSVTPEYELCRLALQRTGVRLDPESHTMVSTFGVQRYLAETMVKSRILLAGDSAHIVSPIGGQGMNLGWMDAADLGVILPDVIAQPDSAGRLIEYSTRRLAAAKSAIRRAEFNMLMGRKNRFPAIRNILARLMLKRPVNRVMAGLFTMRWL